MKLATNFLAIKSYIENFVRHLLLSLYSKDFYQDVYSRYSGHGLKYLLQVSFIVSVLYTAGVLSILNGIQDYFEHSRTNKFTTKLDHIITGLPNFYYNGHKIEFEDKIDKPRFILSPEGNKLLVIDTANHLRFHEDYRIPILKSDYALIPIFSGNKAKFLTIKYNAIFGSKVGRYDTTTLKETIKNYLNLFTRIFVYIGVFVFTIVQITFVTSETLILSCLAYLGMRALSRKVEIKRIFRVLIFATCGPILLEGICYYLPALRSIVSLVQIWAYSLSLYSMHKLKSLSL